MAMYYYYGYYYNDDDSRSPSSSPSRSSSPSPSRSSSPSPSRSSSPSQPITHIPSTLPSNLPSGVPSSIPSTVPSNAPSTSSIPSISNIPSNDYYYYGYYYNDDDSRSPSPSPSRSSSPSPSQSATPSEGPSSKPSDVPSRFSSPSPSRSSSNSPSGSSSPSPSLSSSPSQFSSAFPSWSCNPKFLDSTQWGFTSGYGYYFDVTTLADVKISGIGVHGFSGSVQTIQVWTKVNTYVGFENNPEEWELIQEVSVRAAGFARIGDLPDFAVPLSFSVNTRHAFRIVSDQRFLYGRGATQKQIEEAGDGILSILTGDMTFDPGSFPPIDSSVAFAWNGELRYCQLSAPINIPSWSPTATIAPTFFEDGVFTIPSEFMGISGLYGNYFDVTSARDLNIVGLSVHTFSNLREVKVFTKPGSYDGFETDADSWTLIQTVTNQPSSGFLQSTVLPLFADKIFMSPGDRRAFLVVNVGRVLLSRPFNPNGVGFAGDQYIRIYSGPVSNRAEVFSSYGGAYSFNGAVQYQYNGRIL